MLPIKTDLTYEELIKLIGYDPVSGRVWWLISRGCVAAGTTITGDYIKINGHSYVIGRVIWCIHYKEWPSLDMLIDHKNRRHGDNRIENLRLATPTQNSQNKGGYSLLPKGVYQRDRQSKPYAARIMINGKPKELGSFRTLEQAAEAYQQAALKYHGEFACAE